MKTKSNKLSRAGLTVLEILSVIPSHPSDDFPGGKPRSGTRVFVEYWLCPEIGMLAPYSVPFRLVLVDQEGKQKEIEYGYISGHPLQRSNNSETSVTYYGFGRNWKIAHCKVDAKSRPKLITFDVGKYAMPLGSVNIFQPPTSPEPVVPIEVEKVSVPVEEIPPPDDRIIEQPAWMKPRASVLIPLPATKISTVLPKAIAALEAEFVKPEIVRIISLVCKVNGINPEDLPKYPVVKSDLSPKLRQACRMLAIVLYEKLDVPFAREIFLRAMGRTAMTDFNNVIFAARREYAENLQFAAVVDRSVSELISI